MPRLTTATYRRNGQRGWPGRAVLYADLPNPRAALEALVGPLAEFQLDVIEMPDETARPPEAASEPPPDDPSPSPRAERPRPPLAAALAAEAHLRGTSDPTELPPDALGFAGVMKLMRCA